ncbi:Ctr copper transporter [Patellaria atrata CBS 101060]|uniref:Copper transport protein n=1 Tax=Patellaria atrata CBS 101060 TaxID=1346257 RepID=A0A9P4S4X1_9PEZI|nr:Ctr copper transporter [Patellaria atrata CBS 101060]
MDHGHMDHGDMDMGNGGHHQPMCSMNMLFTWNTENLCIVFRQWRIDSTLSLIVSLLLIVALTAGYELVREASKRYEARTVQKDGLRRQGTQDDQKTKMVKAAFYAVQVFYSFFIMLLFMTYNGFVMLAVAVGAFVGYMAFASSSATKSVACH